MKRRTSRGYFVLVQRFPLLPIRNDAELDAAQELIDELLQRRLDRSEEGYLDVLTDLVEAYEEKHVPIADVSEGDVLRELMRANGLSQADLGKKVGIAQSTISAVLGGNRSLTKSQSIKLANFFGIGPAAFLPAMS